MATIKDKELSDQQGCSASISGNFCLLMVLEVMTEFDWRKNFYVHYLDFVSHLVHLVKTLIYAGPSYEKLGPTTLSGSGYVCRHLPGP